MSDKLSIANLSRLLNELTNLIKIIKDEATEARAAREISSSEFIQVKDEWGKLETLQLRLKGLIDSQSLDYLLDTNVDSPRSRILQATERLKDATRNIDNIGAFLSSVADVISIFGNIAAVISSGGLLTLP